MNDTTTVFNQYTYSFHMGGSEIRAEHKRLGLRHPPRPALVASSPRVHSIRGCVAGRVHHVLSHDSPMSRLCVSLRRRPTARQTDGDRDRRARQSRSHAVTRARGHAVVRSFVVHPSDGPIDWRETASRARACSRRVAIHSFIHS